MKLVEGQLIHNRYRLDRRLAQGGMGEVWKGYDIQLGRVVAIKALRGDLTDVEAKRRRLRIEAHNSADLAHPNIAALFDYYEHDGIGFLIMEYVDSDSLADLYREKGAMDPLELLPILVQVARGLYVAHSHGVIHRDVKPANIMVSKDGEVKITDFGVSYSTNQAQITQDGMVVGTAQYISPEQAQGKKATPQSDIYSLGVVAYEGLCGHRPFTGATPVDIAAAHVNDAVPPLPDSVDLQLSQFVMSMLAKDPRDRPKDALVVSRTLSHIERRLFDQEASLSETTMVSRDGRIARRVVSAPYSSDGSVSASHSTTPKPKVANSRNDDQSHRIGDNREDDEADDITLGGRTKDTNVTAAVAASAASDGSANGSANTSNNNSANQASQVGQIDETESSPYGEFSPAAQAAIQTMTQTLQAITDYRIPPAKTGTGQGVNSKSPQTPLNDDAASAGLKSPPAPTISHTQETNPSGDFAKQPAHPDWPESTSDATQTNVPVTETKDQAANTENQKEQQ